MAGAGKAIARAAKAANLNAANVGLGVGLLAAGRIAKGLKGRKPDLDAEAARTRLSPQTRDQTGDAVYVVGRAKIGGRVLTEQERFFKKGGGDDYQTSDPSPTRYFFQALLLADHKIGGIERMWFGGLEVPLQVGSTAANSTVTRFRSDYETPPTVGVPPTASNFFGDRLATLKAASDALRDEITVPSEDPDDPPGIRYVPPTDVVLRRLYDEIRAEYNSLEFSGRTEIGKPGSVNWWLHAPKFGGLNYVDVLPTIRLTWSDGTHESHVPTSSVDLDARALARLDGWASSDKVRHIAWALLEIRTWLQRVGVVDELYPFGGLTRIPEAAFLVAGDPALGTAAIGTGPVGEWGANPVKWYEWFLKNRCNVPDERVADFTTAHEACDKARPGHAIAADDPTTPDKDHPWTWPQMQDAFFGAGAVVETTVRDRFIVEFNRRYAKPRPTYFAEGLLSGSMSREAVAEALGEACAGSFPYYGGQFHARPGTYAAPAFSIVEADLLSDDGTGRVEWNVQSGEHVNALKAEIGADRESTYEPADVPIVQDSTLVEKHGRYEEFVGRMELVSDVQQAQHLMYVRLRRDAYGLRRCTVQAKTEDVQGRATPFVAPGDWVLLHVEGESLTMLCESARTELVSFGTVGDLEYMQTLTLAETPTNTFDYAWLPPTIAREDALPPEDPEDPTHYMRCTGRFVVPPVPAAVLPEDGYWLELSPEYGPDVRTVHVQIDYRWVGDGPEQTQPSLSFAFTRVEDDPATTGTDETVPLPLLIYVSNHVDGTLNPARAVASAQAFNESSSWEIDVVLTGYGSSLPVPGTFDADDAGTAGEPFTLTLGGPGVPGSTEKQDVVYDRIERPASILARTVVRNARATGGAKLDWKFSRDVQWTAAAVGSFPGFVQITAAADGYDMSFPNGLSTIKGADLVLLAARTGTLDAPSEGTFVKVATMSGAVPSAGHTVQGFAVLNGVGYFGTRHEPSSGGRDAPELFSVNLATGVAAKVGDMSFADATPVPTTAQLRSLWPRPDGKLGVAGRLKTNFEEVGVMDPATAAVSDPTSYPISTSASFAYAGGERWAFERGTGGSRNTRFRVRAAPTTGPGAATEYSYPPAPEGRPAFNSPLVGAASDPAVPRGALLLIGQGVLFRLRPFPDERVVSLAVAANAGLGGMWDGLASDAEKAYAIRVSGTDDDGNATAWDLYRVDGLGTRGDGEIQAVAEVPLFADLKPSDFIKVVTAKPTEAGQIDGELAFTVEDEEEDE